MKHSRDERIPVRHRESGEELGGPTSGQACVVGSGGRRRAERTGEDHAAQRALWWLEGWREAERDRASSTAGCPGPRSDSTWEEGEEENRTDFPPLLGLEKSLPQALQFLPFSPPTRLPVPLLSGTPLPAPCPMASPPPPGDQRWPSSPGVQWPGWPLGGLTSFSVAPCVRAGRCSADSEKSAWARGGSPSCLPCPGGPSQASAGLRLLSACGRSARPSGPFNLSDNFPFDPHSSPVRQAGFKTPPFYRGRH